LIVEVVPSPKFQFQAVGEFVLVSVKATFKGAFPVVGDADKATTGFGETDGITVR
jgi:hypothetical protein